MEAAGEGFGVAVSLGLTVASRRACRSRKPLEPCDPGLWMDHHRHHPHGTAFDNDIEETPMTQPRLVHGGLGYGDLRLVLQLDKHAWRSSLPPFRLLES